MSRHRLIALVIAIIALQVVVAPAVSALTLSTHCSEAGAQDPEQCPCCPDGAAVVAGCASLCIAFSTGVTFTLPALQSTASTEIASPEPPRASHFSAPPNPPPIR